MQVPRDHWEMEFHSFETVQFGPLRVQNSNSEAFIDHSTIFDPKISQYWRVPSCFNRVLPASRNGIQAPVQKVVDWESWESIGENGGPNWELGIWEFIARNDIVGGHLGKQKHC